MIRITTSLLLAVTLLDMSVAQAQQPTGKLDDAAAIESAREALRREAKFPWYDAETDELEQVEIKSQPMPPEIKQWAVKAKKSRGKMKSWNFSWSEFFARFLQYLAWTVLAIILIAGIFYAFRALMETELSLGENELEEEVRTDEERMEQLPVNVVRPKGDFLQEARYYYENGNYSEAIIYLFSYQLMQLDRNQWIRLTKGKTNRQYLKEIHRRTDRSSMDSLQKLSRNTMEIFEDSFFGHHPIDRTRFESCWNRLDDFHQWVMRGTVA